MIVKTKWLCKNRAQVAEGGKWKTRFEKDRVYDGEYETWGTKSTPEEEMFRINGGWRKYWAINEWGEKEEIPKSHWGIIFYSNNEMRDYKIDKILDQEP